MPWRIIITKQNARRKLTCVFETHRTTGNIYQDSSTAILIVNTMHHHHHYYHHHHMNILVASIQKS